MIHYNFDGTKALKLILFIGSSEDPTLQFSSGKLGLIAEILREILSKMLSAAKVVGRNTTKAVNDMHN